VDWAAWYLPGGPVGPPAGWAASSNVEGREKRERGTKSQKLGLFSGASELFIVDL